MSFSEKSRHLRDFEEKGLINCINRENPYNLLYAITNKGLKTLQKLKKLEK